MVPQAVRTRARCHFYRAITKYVEVWNFRPAKRHRAGSRPWCPVAAAQTRTGPMPSSSSLSRTTSRQRRDEVRALRRQRSPFLAHLGRLPDAPAFAPIIPAFVLIILATVTVAHKGVAVSGGADRTDTQLLQRARELAGAGQATEAPSGTTADHWPPGERERLVTEFYRSPEGLALWGHAAPAPGRSCVLRDCWVATGRQPPRRNLPRP